MLLNLLGKNVVIYFVRNTCIILTMRKSLAKQILSHAAKLPEGAPLTAKSLLHLGSRAATDQALSRLRREGKLLRPDRGMYVLPVESRFGTRSPSPEQVVTEAARLRGETVASHGAAAANRLGLTTQVPMRTIFLTSGRSRTLQLGSQRVELRHAPRWQLINAGHSSGEAIRALAWAGPSRAREILVQLRRELPPQAREELVAFRAALPQWMAQGISAELVA